MKESERAMYIISKTHKPRQEVSFCLSIFSLPLLSMLMSSPGSISRTKSAPMQSNAQLSLANTVALPSLPIHSGRKPHLSRAATILSGVAITSENAPSSMFITLNVACSRLRHFIISSMSNMFIISVSLVVWNTLPPRLTIWPRSSAALVMLPLCASAHVRREWTVSMGCVFSTVLLPVVE